MWLQRIHVFSKERSAAHSPVLYAERERALHSRRLRARSLFVPPRGYRNRQHHRSINSLLSLFRRRRLTTVSAFFLPPKWRFTSLTPPPSSLWDPIWISTLLFVPLLITIRTKVGSNPFCSVVYPLFPWEIATACSLSTTQFLDSRPDNRYNPVALESVVSTQKTPLPRALTITMEFGENGNIVDYSISCTTLKRPIRLTYEEVEAILNESTTEQTAKNSNSSNNNSKKKKVFVSSSSAQSDYSFPLHSIGNIKLSTPSSIKPNASLLGFQGSNASLPSTDSIFKRVTSPQLTREEVTSTLQALYRLAKKRRAYRERKGSIDFSFSEARFHVQNGIVDGSIAMDDVSLKVSETP